MRFRYLLVSVALFISTGLVKADPRFPGDLDQAWVHERYNDGNFSVVIDSLQSYMAKHPTYSRHDSVFIAKHLAVVYSADPLTVEKGKFYMYRLLGLVPSVDLVDMYVSEAIERIFERVRREFSERQGGTLASAGVQSPAPIQDAAPPRKPASDSSRETKPVATHAAAAAGSPPGNHAGVTPKAAPGPAAFFRRTPVMLGLAALAVGTMTYVALSGSQESEPSPKVYHVR